jgi:GMP synthase-like glutamine amidotransferase
MMRVGLLECDHVDERHRPIAGDYRDMFSALLAGPAPDAELVGYDVVAGRMPTSTDECDAWLCTGSRRSVYDTEPWIAGLSAFVRELRQAGARFVGICFGHQLLAHALGGWTTRAPGGWGAGAHRLDVRRTEPWMDPPTAAPSLLFVHQDQVQRLPDGGVVLASAPHCDIAMLAVGDTMLGIQAHPEFGAAYVDALLAGRAERIGEERAAAARRSLGEPTDASVVARWIVNFLRGG